VRFVNLTPHTIDIIPLSVSIPPSGSIAKVIEGIAVRERVNWEGHVIDIVEMAPNLVAGLPQRVEGVLYIASTIVAVAAWALGRDDVVCPSSSVRNDGKVMGCMALQRSPTRAK
jgi:hypothetical protein